MNMSEHITSIIQEEALNCSFDSETGDHNLMTFFLDADHVGLPRYVALKQLFIYLSHTIKVLNKKTGKDIETHA